MPKISVGVIGTGSIGNVHLTGYANAPQMAKIQAICDINPERLAEMGEKFNVPEEHRYTNYKKMLDSEKLDAVSVCVPNALHFPIASETIKRGINTLIEKPMVLTMEQAKELKKLADKSGVKTMVAFSHRFHTGNIAAKKLLDSGAIGNPFMIRVRYAHNGPYPGWAQSDWFYKKKIAGGGALLDMGIHAIDITQYFIGPIKSVSALSSALRKDIEVDDNAVMALDFGPAKCYGYIECGWTSGPGFVGIEIYGDQGTMILDYDKGFQVFRGAVKPDGSVSYKTQEIKPAKGPSFWPLELESWIKYVAGKKPVTYIPGLEEGTSSLAVALAAMESNKTGKRVPIKIK